MRPESIVVNLPLPQTYDVFVDLSASDLDAAGLETALRRIVHSCGYGAAAGDIGFAAPARLLDGAPSPVAAFRFALAAAARERRQLLVILGDVLPPNEIVGRLAAAFRDDPLIGTAQPRFAEAGSGMILSLGADRPADGVATIHPDTLPGLPPFTITAEFPAAVLLLRQEVVEGAVVPEGVTTLLGALVGVLVAARRRGFRNAVVSDAVVAIEAEARTAHPELRHAEFQLLSALYPEMARASDELEHLPLGRYERLLDAMRPPRGLPRRLLIDGRSLAPVHNGTSRVNLGMLEGLVQSPASWEIDVAVRSEAAAFHDLQARFPGMRFVDGPVGVYAAAYTPNQPWGVEAIAELHRVAAVLVYSMLDTIAWDVVYAGPPTLGDTWRILGCFADGLTFISGFTRERFVRRFQPPAATLLRVVHLSLTQEENTRPEFRGRDRGDQVLVVGNTYDHKALAPTIDTLLRAFPLTRFAILGLEGTSTSRVTYLSSGKATDEDVHTLFATARAVVYPSCYEGFGLPAVEGLAYGQDVLVRRSALWEEIAAHADLPGRLIPYDDALSLADALDGVLSGAPVEALPQGTRVEGSPTDWAAHAADTLEAIEACLEAFDPERWRVRDAIFQSSALRGR